MGWFASHIAGGVVRWITATIIAGVCVMLGFSPVEWFVAFVGQPPNWLIHPLTRVLIILFGVISIGFVLLRKGESVRESLPLPNKRTPRPNVAAADAFDKIIERSPWAKNAIKTVDVSRYFYPEGTDESQKPERAVSYKLANDIHDHLRQGTITAWGKFSKNDGDSTPERLISADEWDDIRLILDRRKTESGLQVSCAYSNVDRAPNLNYLQVRFCEQQINTLYPLSWRKRKVVVFPTKLIQHPSPPPSAPISLPPIKKSGLEWNIEGNPERINFLGLSMGPSGLQAHHFWVRGWNRTIEPITAPRVYIRAENTAEEFNGLFNAGDGKMLSADKIRTIPVGAMIDITVPFRPDRKPIPLSTFLAEFVPFTFFFVSPEISYRQTITQEQIAYRIKNFQDIITAKMITRPKIQLRRDDDVV
jgi:hypothetical protein